MKIKLVNNWKYKAQWNNILYYNYNVDHFNIKHLLIGFFGFFLFICW
jgi:hypothetical protein